MSRKQTKNSPPAVTPTAAGTDEENPQRAEMVKLLEGRLEKRKDSQGSAYRLDLRNKALGPLRDRAYLTLRDPAAPGWPEPLKGDSTQDESTAKDWIGREGGYADWVLGQLETVEGTVAWVADRLLERLTAERAPDDSTLRNRRSCIKEHIRPRLGTVPMSKLDRPKVRAFLTGLTVFVAKGRPRRPAARHTVDAVRDTLNDIWKVYDEDRSAPWAGMRIKLPSDRSARVHEIRAGKVGAGRPLKKGYTPEEVKRALVAAMWYDLHAIELVPNVAVTAVPNTAGMITCMLCCGMRLGELVYWRWHQILTEIGAVWLPGTKNESANRYAPLQFALLPWLAWLQEQRKRRGCRVDPASYVASATWKLRKDPTLEYVPTGRNTYDRRIALALILAGLKLPQKSTHIWRSTHITWAERLGSLPIERVQDFVGHTAPYGKTTTGYMDRGPEFFRDEDRQYIEIPTPQEIAALVPTFEPTVPLEEARRRYAARRTMP